MGILPPTLSDEQIRAYDPLQTPLMRLSRGLPQGIPAIGILRAEQTTPSASNLLNSDVPIHHHRPLGVAG